MKAKMISYTLATLPKMTEARFEELMALSERPESETDFSEIRELTDERMKNAIFYRPVKQQITARLGRAPLAEILKAEATSRG